VTELNSNSPLLVNNLGSQVHLQVDNLSDRPNLDLNDPNSPDLNDRSSQVFSVLNNLHKRDQRNREGNNLALKDRSNLPKLVHRSRVLNSHRKFALKFRQRVGLEDLRVVSHLKQFSNSKGLALAQAFPVLNHKPPQQAERVNAQQVVKLGNNAVKFARL
jgi:hypothetical protein